jgi:hypothetical protein
MLHTHLHLEMKAVLAGAANLVDKQYGCSVHHGSSKPNTRLSLCMTCCHSTLTRGHFAACTRLFAMSASSVPPSPAQFLNDARDRLIDFVHSVSKFHHLGVQCSAVATEQIARAVQQPVFACLHLCQPPTARRRHGTHRPALASIRGWPPHLNFGPSEQKGHGGGFWGRQKREESVEPSPAPQSSAQCDLAHQNKPCCLYQQHSAA